MDVLSIAACKVVIPYLLACCEVLVFCADLSGGNVMLRTAEDCRHGAVTAKVADFGLSRIMDVQSRMQTRMYGTVRS